MLRPYSRFLGCLAIVWLASTNLALGQGSSDGLFAEAREALVRDRIAAAGVSDERVLKSIRTTPRHEFVPDSEVPRAYFDMALAIGGSQTISSPFIVAMMTEALDPQPTDRVLEIGTGSGYQAAVLSPLVADVYTIEIVEELGLRAAETLRRLNYDNVHTRIGDGYLGWPDAAPFDKIIVTCSPESIPQPLVDQLRDGGQMIIPVGERYQQTLYRLIKTDGELKRMRLRPTLFVPMTGAAEDSRQVKPDVANPVVVNGDFELEMEPQGRDADAGPSSSLSVTSLSGATSGENNVAAEFVRGWYYGRQVRRVVGDSETGRASAGEAFVRCQNETPGLSSHLLQGIPIDGRQVSTIRLSGMVRTDGVRTGEVPDARPMIAISLYDEQRRDLGSSWLGPFQSSQPWRQTSRVIQIPLQTREAILRIGLFGATGTVDFDEIAIRKIN